MARVKREAIIDAALDLLDESGLDCVSTRRLAERLGIESASLYWHFKNKSELFNEMSAAVLTRHHQCTPPANMDGWQEFMLENARSFRNALRAHRDGARLHAGSRPVAAALPGILAKVDYLCRAGFTKHDAGLALYTTSQFTIGCVLEEQATQSAGRAKQRKHAAAGSAPASASPALDASEAFEFGLGLLVDGLRSKQAERR